MACVVCEEAVRPRQEAFQCDQCDLWQHRTCDTGISRDLFRAVNRGDADFAFICNSCKDEPIAFISSFHWTQAVYRKAGELAIQGPYRQRGSVHAFVRRVLALVYLPEDRIPAAFDRLKAKTDAPALMDLMSYVERRWILSDLWGPSCWSVYGQATRTNNDVEGWHRRINDKAAGGNLWIYKLVPLLSEEASLLPLQQRLVSEGKLSRHQKKQTRSLQAKLFDLWGRYADGEMSSFTLLKRCATLTD